MSVRRFLPLLVGSVLASTGASAAVLTVNFDSGDFTFQDTLGNALSVGNPLIDGDGVVLELGYYTGATIADNFLGTWVALTGAGSANTGNIAGTSINFNQTSIGDAVSRGGGDPGTFYISVTFDTTVANKSQSLPALNTPLSIRFYNQNASLRNDSSTLYNAVSNDGWLWQAFGEPGPSQPVMTISLSDTSPNLESESVAKGQAANTVFRTVMTVPEPTSGLIGLAGLLGVLGFRRRSNR
jgi:MYXO-CTERM domain-containing protein